jgi:hypothetical protein
MSEVWPTSEQIDKAEIDLIAEHGFDVDDIKVAKARCMCGDMMENHSSPMDCGHTPLDTWTYAVFCRASEIAEAENG